MIASGKWLLNISNFSPLPFVVRSFWRGQEWFLGKGHCCCQYQCIGTGDPPYPQKWGSNYSLKPKMVNSIFQHRTPFVLPTNVTLKLASINNLFPLRHWQRSLTLFPHLSNEHIALRRKNQHLRNQYSKMCTHYLHQYFSESYFSLRYQHQVINLIRLGIFFYTYPLLVYLGELTIKYSLQDPLPRKSEFGMVSNFWCQIFSTLMFWGRHTNFKEENIIVDMVSMSVWPLCGTYFYLNQRTKFRCKNIFVGMVTHFKNNSRWARSIITFLLTVHWNYCTQHFQMDHALPQYIYIFLNRFWI